MINTVAIDILFLHFIYMTWNMNNLLSTWALMNILSTCMSHCYGMHTIFLVSLYTCKSDILQLTTNINKWQFLYRIFYYKSEIFRKRGDRNAWCNFLRPHQYVPYLTYFLIHVLVFSSFYPTNIWSLVFLHLYIPPTQTWGYPVV